MRYVTVFILSVLAFFVISSCAHAGILQDQAVKVASESTGMQLTSWHLNVTNDLPKGENGMWDPIVPRVANVRPLSFFLDYQSWCTVIVHEAWHVKNQNDQHSSDPNNVLYSEFPSPTNYIYPQCREVPSDTSFTITRPDPYRRDHHGQHQSKSKSVQRLQQGRSAGHPHRQDRAA
jgi:hypothetical protein